MEIDAEFGVLTERTERFFRFVNDEVAGLEASVRPETSNRGAVTTVMCECAMVQCMDEIEVPTSDLARIRGREERFIVRPWHYGSPQDEVVERTDEYWVLEHEAVTPSEAGEPASSARPPDELLQAIRAVFTQRQHVQAREVEVSAQSRVFERRVEEARHAAQRYERATRRYTRLMSHRIANPLAVISGMAITLREVEDLDPPRRCELLDAIIEQAELLRKASAEAKAMDIVEQPLDPWGTDDRLEGPA